MDDDESAKTSKIKIMEPLSIISLISLVFSVIATGAEMAITEHQNQQNIQLQQDTLHQQQEYATQAAERANDTTVEQYNMLYSPAARRRQLEDANLSVGLMYGGGGSFGQGSTAAQAATPTTNVPYMNPLLQPGQMGNVMNALKTITEAENTQAETNKTEEEILNLQKVREEIDKNMAKADAEIKLIEEQANTQKITQNNIKLQNDLLELQKDYESQTQETRVKTCKESLNLIIAQEEKCWEEINGLSIDNKYKGQLYHWQIEKLKGEQQKLIAEKALVEAQKILTEWQQKNQEWESILRGQESDIKDQQIKQAEWSTKLSEQEYYKAKNEAAILEEKLKEYKKYGAKIMESNGWAQTLVNLLVSLGYKIDQDSSNGGL